MAKKFLVKKFPVVTSITVLITFVGLFIYYYKKNPRFRLAVLSSLLAIGALLGSSPLEAKAAGFVCNDPISSQPQRDGGYRSNAMNNGSGQPDNSGSGSAGQSESGSVNIPKLPKVDSVETGQEMLQRIQAEMAQLENSMDSESESEGQCEVTAQESKNAKKGSGKKRKTRAEKREARQKRDKRRKKQDQKNQQQQNQQQLPTVTTSIEDPGLQRAAEAACTNDQVRNELIHLEEQLAAGNERPGIGLGKYICPNVWEHRTHNGARLFVRKFENGKRLVIVGKSGKSTKNQKFVINRVKEIYGKKS